MKPSAPTTNCSTCQPTNFLSNSTVRCDLTDDVRKIDRITHQLQWLATFIKRWEKVTRGPGAEHFENDFPGLEKLPDRGEEELWDYLEEFYENIRQARH